MASWLRNPAAQCVDAPFCEPAARQVPEAGASGYIALATPFYQRPLEKDPSHSSRRFRRSRLAAHRLRSRQRFGLLSLDIGFATVKAGNKHKQNRGNQHKQRKERVVICSL